MKKGAVLLLLFLAAIPCRARTIYVDDDLPADFNNIQAGIDDANDGDTVVVMPGRYAECINFLGKNITVRSTDPEDPELVRETIIDWDGTHRSYEVVVFRGTEDPNCTLAGFKVNGSIIGYDAPMRPDPPVFSRATIDRCDFHNAYTENGKVIIDCDGLISNCLIAKTTGLICVCRSSVIYTRNGTIRNCTIAETMYGDAIRVGEGGMATVQNCILHDSDIVLYTGSTLNVDHTLFESIVLAGLPEAINIGPGNLKGDPCFVSPAYWDSNDTPDDPYDDFYVEGVDYHLKSQGARRDRNSGAWVIDDVTSPCIDAGDPVSPIGDEPFGNGGIINMGAYGGTVEASKSYFGRPPCKTVVAGDINGDCQINFRDFQLMALHWCEEGY